MFFETALPLSLFVTVGCELFLAYLWQWKKSRLHVFAIVCSVHAVSHPFGILYVYHVLGTPLVFAEGLIIVFEAVMYTALIRTPFKDALLFSCIANATSFFCGVAFWYFFGILRSI